MKPFYTLSHAAGLIRSNKFLDKADAICVGSFRAQYLDFPVKIFEHDEEGERKTLLVCNPDGSVEKPQALAHETIDYGQMHNSFRNSDQAHVVFASYGDKPRTTYYLKSALAETKVKEIETKAGCELGLFDNTVVHAYTDDAGQLKLVEEGLSEAGVEIEKVRENSSEAVAASLETVVAARKAHQAARQSNFPEMRIRANLRGGNSFRFTAHCELVPGDGTRSPYVVVYADGRKVGEAKSERDAASVIRQEAERAFSRYLKKEL